MDKLYPITELYRRMKELGLPTGKMWVWRQEKKDSLRFKRLPNGEKLLTEKEMAEIIDAYIPGGKGWWYAEGLY